MNKVVGYTDLNFFWHFIALYAFCTVGKNEVTKNHPHSEAITFFGWGEGGKYLGR